MLRWNKSSDAAMFLPSIPDLLEISAYRIMQCVPHFKGFSNVCMYVCMYICTYNTCAKYNLGWSFYSWSTVYVLRTCGDNVFSMVQSSSLLELPGPPDTLQPAYVDIQEVSSSRIHPAVRTPSPPPTNNYNIPCCRELGTTQANPYCNGAWASDQDLLGVLIG